LSELEVQYGDYAVWQREWLEGEVLEEQLGYWKEKLADMTVIELPSDRERVEGGRPRGAKIEIEVGEEVTKGLRELSRRESVTLFMTLLAAFKVLLNQYTGQHDVALGTDIANRNRAELEGVIGLFINNLVLRTSLAGDPTFKELLNRTRETTLEAYARQDLPFERIVEELQPERNLSNMPLFRVLFVLQNIPVKSIEIDSLKVTVLNIEAGTSKYDLSLFLEETRTGLAGAIEYNANLFDQTTIERMRGDFQTLLAEIVANPGSAISSYSAAREDEFIRFDSDFEESFADL
jgi:non-ribosomal peptide synthetase component F